MFKKVSLFVFVFSLFFITAQKSLTDAKTAEFKLQMQIDNLSSRGTVELTAPQEAKAMIEAAKAKYTSFLAETKIKIALLDIEEKIVLARLRILALQDPQLAKEADLIATQLTKATGASKSALGLEMGNAAKTFKLELVAAIKTAFGDSTFEGLRATTLANEAIKNVNQTARAVEAERLKDRAFEVEKARVNEIFRMVGEFGIASPGQNAAAKKVGEQAGETFDRLNPPAPKELEVKPIDEVSTKTAQALASSLQIKEALNNSIETFKKFGPEGEFVSSVLQGGIDIQTSYSTMQDTFTGLTDKANEGMLKMAAGAQFAASAIGSIGQMMAANSAKQIGAIDEQIAAEEKRDGKSAGSVAKLKALEAKKDQMKRKAFNQDKKMQMAQVVMSTAASVIQSYYNGGGYPLGIPAAMAMAGLGALNLALIASTSYDGAGAGGINQAQPSSLTIGSRNNSVDVSQRASSGELSYMRGERGSGTGANDFRTGGATGIKGYAAGKKGYNTGGLIVGEQGPERIDVIPNEGLNTSRGETSVVLNISAIDGQSVETMFNDNQGKIISMIQSAANDNGSQFLPEVDSTVYGTSGTGG